MIKSNSPDWLALDLLEGLVKALVLDRTRSPRPTMNSKVTPRTTKVKSKTRQKHLSVDSATNRRGADTLALCLR